MGEAKVGRTPLSPVIKDARALGLSRATSYRKGVKFKVSFTDFRKEIMSARMVGELSAGERILHLLNESGDMTSDELKGELHKFVVDVHNLISEEQKLGRNVSVEHFTNAL